MVCIASVERDLEDCALAVVVLGARGRHGLIALHVTLGHSIILLGETIFMTYERARLAGRQVGRSVGL